MRLLLLLTATLGLGAPLCATDPNFSGTWRLDPDASDTRALPVAPSRLLSVDHDGAFVRCRESEPDGAEWAFSTDRKEVKSRWGALTLASIGKWEGEAALVNTIVSGPGRSYTQADRWKLSRDGTRLTVRRELVRPQGEVREALLVYQLQDAPASARPPEPDAPGLAQRQEVSADYRINSGTRIPLVLINSVSTRQSQSGDRVYLQTAFPVLSGGRVVVPPGSYVAGTLTFVKKPGRVKGRGELYLRFDTLTLPNGVTRDFRARPGSADADIQGEMDRKEGKIRSESDRMGDARTVGEATASGASVGAIAGAAAGRAGMGAAVGGAAGAAAGVLGVLLTRGPDIVLSRGTTIEMILDRPLLFSRQDLEQR